MKLGGLQVAIKFSHDSLGAPEEIIDDGLVKVGEDWKSQDIIEDEKVLVNEAFRKINGEWQYVDEYVFEDDIMEYIKTLEPTDLLDILLNMDVKEIREAANMEEVYL